MRTVRFKETRTERSGAGRTFEKGCAYSLPEASARHWVCRNAADYDDTNSDPLQLARDAHLRAEVYNAALAVAALDPSAPFPEQSNGGELFGATPEQLGAAAQRAAVVEHELKDDGDPLESTPVVDGTNSSDLGERPKHVGQRRRGRPPGSATRNRDQ